jgi:hypothetical protein
MRPVALPCLSHDRLTATNCIALEDKASTAHTSTETRMELEGYLYRKRAIPPPPPPKLLDSRRSKRHASLHASNGYKFYFTDTGALAKCSVF